MCSRSPKIGIGVLVVKDGRILLGQRLNSHGEGHWAPPGGHLEFGETPFECTKRELLEETNLEALKIEEGPWTNDIFKEENKHYVSIFMFVPEFRGELKVMEKDRVIEWKWFDFDSLPTPLFSSLENLVSSVSLESLYESFV